MTFGAELPNLCYNKYDEVITLNKKKTLSNDEALVELFKVSLKHIKDSDELDMKYLQLKKSRIKSMISFKYDEEPLKIFKKAHKKWREELDALEQELYDFYLEAGALCEEQMEFYQKLKEA